MARTPNTIQLCLMAGMIAVTTALYLPTAGSAAETDEEIAFSVATLLRSARAIISDKQAHINNPNVGDESAAQVLSAARDLSQQADTLRDEIERFLGSVRSA